jgi:hypothetical protein
MQKSRNGLVTCAEDLSVDRELLDTLTQNLSTCMDCTTSKDSALDPRVDACTKLPSRFEAGSSG